MSESDEKLKCFLTPPEVILIRTIRELFPAHAQDEAVCAINDLLYAGIRRPGSWEHDTLLNTGLPYLAEGLQIDGNPRAEKAGAK